MLNRNKFESHKRKILKLLLPFKDQLPQVLMALDRVNFDDKNPFNAYEEMKVLLEFYVPACERQVKGLYKVSFFTPIFLYNNYEVALSLSDEACASVHKKDSLSRHTKATD